MSRRVVYFTGKAFSHVTSLRRLHLNGSESQQVSFSLEPRQLAFVGAHGKRVEAPGADTISIGGHQPGTGNIASTAVLQRNITISGEPVSFP